MARGRQSAVDVVALSLTLDVNHAAMLDRVVQRGLYGRSRNEVASSLVRLWLYENLAAFEDKYRSIEGRDTSVEGGS